ncbi:NUC153 and WD40 repeat-containing nucleolar rRNA processing-related protein [Suillus americanus]|nr:NUC153 and WD40 repeat-containing nucleolar rRNA processing-related protein [Suillus americanus]
MDVKVYTVNGAVAGSSSSIPDWLIRKRAAKGKGKRVSKEHVQGAIELIQGFEFPEASNRIKTTRDGHHAIATGTYKPQTRVWDLDDLNLKFERHSDAENVDFINDRTIELHTQGGFHYRTRIPRFGRSLAYHFPSCTALFSASGNEIYRLNLEQGRFLSPLVLQDDNIQGVNCIDINPTHHLLAFGVDGNGTVQFWDLRSRSPVGVLQVPTTRLLSHTARSTMPGVDDTDALSIGITALASRSDGLSYAVGTSTGHTLLYDIRSSRPFALKDQGYGLPIRNLTWIEGGRLAGDGMVLSADKKVVKIWDRNSPSSNFVSITPANDLNHIHHVPGSGLFLTANEGIQMGTYYVPALGPAPRWASFLENVTEEMEDSSTRNAYEDFKFVERSELKTLGLDHLIGTPALKPYMHGYFLSLHLYDTARVIANPFAYAEHREKLVKERMEKMAETRIRTKKGTGVGTGTGVGGEEVKVNKALAERIEKGLEKERRKEERRRRGTKGGEDEEAMDVDIDASADEAEQTPAEFEKPTLLNDPRFKDLFLNPEFAVDETTREYALLHPSASGSKQKVRGKTAVEEEEEESERASSAGISEDESENESEGGDSDDSSDAGELNKFDPRARPGQKNERAHQAYTRTRQHNRQSNANINFVPLVPHTESSTSARKTGDKTATFGQRRNAPARGSSHTATPRGAANGSKGGFEMSWVPSSTKDPSRDRGSRKDGNARKGVEVFGAGMERGGGDGERSAVLSESERTGRSQRRKGMRSGSKNVFRRLG